MEKSRRAEQTIACVRWLVFSCLLTETWRLIPRYHIYAIIGSIIVYNAVALICLTEGRYNRFGRTASSFARVLDILTIALIDSYLHSPSMLANIAYICVLLGSALATSGASKVTLTFCAAIAACAASTWYASSPVLGFFEFFKIFEIRGIAICFGWLISLYIAVSRSRSDLASEMESLLKAAFSCKSSITGHTSLRALSDHLLRNIVNHTAADGGQLWLTNEISNELKCEASFIPDSSARPIANSYSPIQETLHAYAGTVVETGAEILIQADKSGSNAVKVDRNTRPLVAVPLIEHSSEDSNSQAVGAIIIWGTPGRYFSQNAINIVRTFAAMSSGAIWGLLHSGNIQRSYLSTLQDMARILEDKNSRTRGHSQRVMQIACMVAEKLGVSAEGMYILQNAALLHDIGKIGIPYWLFTQVDGLSAFENETQGSHPVIGENICRSAGLSPDILFLVRHHHEALDGRGYPDALSAQEQPLLQRILAAANSFDNIFSKGPYGELSIQSILHTELRRSAGTTMDPTIIDTLLQIAESGKLHSVYANYGGIGCTQAIDDQFAQREAS